MAGALESAEAKAFLESMLTPEQLMPQITVEDIRKLLAPGGDERHTGELNEFEIDE